MTHEVLLPLQVNIYLQSQGKAVRSAAVIQSNPDQSKHLETARMKINDVWIDLVNLRSDPLTVACRPGCALACLQLCLHVLASLLVAAVRLLCDLGVLCAQP
jgi:hypothetical protein